MLTFGWIEEMPAILDEYGVVINRRMIVGVMADAGLDLLHPPLNLVGSEILVAVVHRLACCLNRNDSLSSSMITAFSVFIPNMTSTAGSRIEILINNPSPRPSMIMHPVGTLTLTRHTQPR
jgi:hypothetical protein